MLGCVSSLSRVAGEAFLGAQGARCLHMLQVLRPLQVCSSLFHNSAISSACNFTPSPPCCRVWHPPGLSSHLAHREQLQELREAVTSPRVGMQPDDFLPVVCDVTKEAEVSALPAIITKHWPDAGIDVLVNNAGQDQRAAHVELAAGCGQQPACVPARMQQHTLSCCAQSCLIGVALHATAKTACCVCVCIFVLLCRPVP